MALTLTPFRWIALAAIGCMLAIIAVVSAVPSLPDPSLYADARIVDTTDKRLRDIAGGLTQQSQNMATRYRQLLLMDSVRRVASRLPDTGVVRVFIASEYTPSVRSSIDKTVRDARNIRRGDAGRIDLFVISDTLQVIRGVRRWTSYPSVRYELPGRQGDRCRVFVTTGEADYLANAFTSDRSSQQLLGPCGFYMAFGEPGALVRKWLIDGGWQYSLEGSWTVAPLPLDLGEDPGIFKGPSPALRLLNVESGAAECIKGSLDKCEHAVAVVPSVRPIFRLPGVTPPSSLGRRRYYAGLAGYHAGELLSDAVRELGRERFRTFWTSPDSVPAAFQKASGERWGAFIQRWMISHYGEVHPGPRMSAYALITSTILVIIALGATMLVSVRRTYV
jgi:hypothetical protein